MKRTTLACAVAAVLGAPNAMAAVIYDENTDGSLGDTFASRTLLAPGVDTVKAYTGYVDRFGSDVDYFSFTGLTAGDNFSLTFDCTAGDGVARCEFSLLDGVGSALASQSVHVSDTPYMLNGMVTSSGQLNIFYQRNASEFSEATVSLETTPGVSTSRGNVPVPGGALLLGAGALSGAAFRRRRRKHSLKD